MGQIHYTSYQTKWQDYMIKGQNKLLSNVSGFGMINMHRWYCDYCGGKSYGKRKEKKKES